MLVKQVGHTLRQMLGKQRRNNNIYWAPSLCQALCWLLTVDDLVESSQHSRRWMLLMHPFHRWESRVTEKGSTVTLKILIAWKQAPEPILFHHHEPVPAFREPCEVGVHWDEHNKRQNETGAKLRYKDRCWGKSHIWDNGLDSGDFSRFC